MIRGLNASHHAVQTADQSRQFPSHPLYPKAAVHRVPRPCPPRRSEPCPARAAKDGAASAAPVDPGGQVSSARRLAATTQLRSACQVSVWRAGHGVSEKLGLEGVRRFLGSLFGEDVHAMRVLSMANATLGVLSSASRAVHAIGLGSPTPGV